MSTFHQSTTALLTEHFRYTPLTLLDDIINTVNELVFRAINAVEEGLAGARPDHLGFDSAPAYAARLANLKTTAQREKVLYQLKNDEVDAGIVQLESLLNATVDRDFDKFEIYTLRNILSVGHEEEGLADWVQLDHYKGLDFEDAEKITPEELQLQRRKLHESKKLNVMLKAEEARNNVVLEQLQRLVGVANSEQGLHSEDGNGLASTNLAFLESSDSTGTDLQTALTQLPALRNLLDQLKSSLKDLPQARRTVDEEAPEIKRQRYIDAQSLRVLERRGISTPGEKESETGMSGQRIAADDIQGLEDVVRSMESEGK